MALVPFSPPPGINSDDTTFAAEGRWASGNNVRFHLGRAQPIGSVSTLFTLPLSGVCTDIFAFTRSGSVLVAYGQPDKISIGSQIVSPSDRSPSPSPSLSTSFSFAAWGSAATTLLAAQYTGTLYEQSGSSAATEVTQAPNKIDSGILVTPERQVLAFGCNEVGGTHNQMCIRGCDLEDYTDWTPTSSNNAFEHILDGLGAIVLARQVGPYIAVLTTSGLYLGQFIGDPSQTYRFDKVADGCGALNSRSAAVFAGRLYWMGMDYQMRVWVPGAEVQIIPCQLSRDLMTNAGGTTQAASAFVVTNHAWEEIWFFYYDIRDTETGGASRYVAYSLRESALAQSPVWFSGAMERTAMLDSNIIRTVTSGNNTSMIGVNTARSVMLHEIASAGFSAASIRSAGFYLDDSQRRTMIKSMIPDFEDQSGNVTINLYVRDRPQSSSTTKGPHTLGTSTTKKDFRASGKIFEVELSSSSVKWRLGKPLFDVVPMGER